jgi:hypothetical protein
VQGKAVACPTCKPMQARQQAQPPPQQQPQQQQTPSIAPNELSGASVPEFDLENVDWDALEKLAVEVRSTCLLFGRADESAAPLSNSPVPVSCFELQRSSPQRC